MRQSGGKSRKKISKFWIGFIITVLVLLIAIMIGLIWFFNWLQDYENSERHHVAESVVALCENGDYKAVASMTDVVMSGLESEEVYAEEIGKLLKGKTIAYSKAFSYDRFEKPIYKITADGEYVCKLVLRKEGKSKYGFDTYAADYFTAFDFGTGSAAFLVPDFYQVYCNGKLLDDKFITQKGLNPELLKYALTDEEAPSLSRYEVTGLTSRCEIIATDSRGGSVTLAETGGKYEASFESMRFAVPDDVSVFVNGVKLGEKYKTGGSGGTEQSYAPMLYSDAAVTGFSEYRVDYISPESEYRAVDGLGAEVELRLGSDGVYRAGLREFSLRVPEGFRVTAGGVELSSSERWTVKKGIEVEELATILTKYLPERPTLCEYRFSVIDDGNVPEVSIVTATGETVLLTPDGSGLFTYGFEVDTDVPELTKLAVSRVKNYAEYITNDMGQWDFLQMILEDQPMFTELKDNPYYFYTGHKKHWFENEVWDNLKVYCENCFSCEVRFDYYIGEIKTNPDFVKMLPLDVTFWFVKYQNKWYMAEWQISS